MVDSGNCLRDYLTHRPVIVIPQARGNRLFGLEDTPLRPIFADTAGGRQMMFCLTPERTILCDGRNEWAVEAMLGTFAGAWGERPGSAAGLAAEPERRTRGGLSMEKRKSRSNGGGGRSLQRWRFFAGGDGGLHRRERHSAAPLTREEEQALFLSMDEQPETARPDADRAQPAAGRLHRQKI